MTTWAEAWDRFTARILIVRTPPEPQPTPEPVDHTERGCCEAHILYGKPNAEVPTGLMNGSSAQATPPAAPRRTSSRKGRRLP